jgi:hypothetical protein
MAVHLSDRGHFALLHDQRVDVRFVQEGGVARVSPHDRRLHDHVFVQERRVTCVDSHSRLRYRYGEERSRECSRRGLDELLACCALHDAPSSGYEYPHDGRRVDSLP